MRLFWEGLKGVVICCSLKRCKRCGLKEADEEGSRPHLLNGYRLPRKGSDVIDLQKLLPRATDPLQCSCTSSWDPLLRTMEPVFATAVKTYCKRIRTGSVVSIITA